MFKLKNLDRWNSMTWKDMIVNARNLKEMSEEDIKEFIYELHTFREHPSDYHELLNSKVTGSTICGWKPTDYNTVPFVASFNSVSKRWKDWTIVEYLIDVNIESIKKGYPINLREFGRALAAMPSFFREDLITLKLQRLGFDAELASEEADLKEHVDIELRIEGVLINIWSYNKSVKSYVKLVKKVNDRGKIRSGLNLLAPFNRSSRSHSDILHDWSVPSDKYINRLIKIASGSAIQFNAQQASNINYYNIMKLFKYN